MLHGVLALIVLWNSAQEAAGIARLDEIRLEHPEVPVLLVVNNPSREYLLAALQYPVEGVLTLPLDQQQFQQILRRVARTMRPRGLGQWLERGWTRMEKSLRRAFAGWPAPGRGADRGLEALGVALQPSLPFFNQKLEQGRLFDIQVQFFGDLDIKIKGVSVPEIAGKKNVAVLAYLLFHHCKSIHKDILMDLFWSDVTPASARNSLNVAMCSIRKTLNQAYSAQEIILYNSDNYCINTELEVLTDVDKFIYFWKKGRAIEASQGLADALGAYDRAVALYKDEFLSSVRLDDWCETERDNLREIYLFILNRLSTYAFEQKDYNACINLCQKMLAKDECLEDIHRQLMASYQALGLTDLAQKQYFKCEKALERELSMRPSETTRALFQKIKNGRSVLV